MPVSAPVTTIHPLCYEHHSEMILPDHASNEDSLPYACREFDCLVHYSRSGGYFLNTASRELIELYPPPRERCSIDGHPMYLLEVQPEHRSFRLWRCPKCNMSRSAGTLTWPSYVRGTGTGIVCILAWRRVLQAFFPVMRPCFSAIPQRPLHPCASSCSSLFARA